VLPLLFTFASTLAIPGDEDEDMYEYMRALMLGPLSGIPVAGKIIDKFIRSMLGIDYFRWGTGGAYSPAFTMFDDIFYIGDRVNKFFDDELDEQQQVAFWRHLAGFVGSLTGTPAKQGYDYTRGAGKIVEGDVLEGLLILIGYTPYRAARIVGSED